MDTITIERAATAIPVKRRLKFGLKRLALACLALAVTLGGIAYGRYWWTVGRFIESTDDAYAGGNVFVYGPAGLLDQRAVPQCSGHIVEDLGIEFLPPETGALVFFL